MSVTPVANHTRTRDRPGSSIHNLEHPRKRRGVHARIDDDAAPGPDDDLHAPGRRGPASRPTIRDHHRRNEVGRPFRADLLGAPSPHAGISYTYKNVTLDLRYHDTDLNKTECFLNTTDPRGLFTGSGQSNWCGTRFIATLSADFTASALGVFVPGK
jgi:hypothetical protein